MSTASELRSRIRAATERLRSIGSDNPRLEAEHLAAHALGLDRQGMLLLRDQDPLADEFLDRYEELVQRRLDREPLQYILGTVPFYDLELEVGPGVLVPRPETEIFVSRVLHWITSLELDAPTMRKSSRIDAPSHARPPVRSGPGLYSSSSAGATPWIVDVGTGTGAILLSLLAHLPSWSGLGIDRSESALAYAMRNRDRNRRVAAHAHFLCGNLLEPVAHRLPARDAPGGPERAWLGAVVSNPPYVPTRELAALAPEVIEHEPRLALDGGIDGRALVDEIIEQSASVLAPGGLLAFELGLGQSEQVAHRLAGSGYEVLERFHDLTGRDRGVITRRRA